jgi:hypothetical protein
MKDAAGFLENGFTRIGHELDLLEEKADNIAGAIFKRHKYSEENLLHSDHLDKVSSFSAKIKADLENWESANILPFKVQLLYNQHAQEVHDRLDEIIIKIKQRTPTVWEKVCNAFTHLYKVILECLLPLAGGKIAIAFNRGKKATFSKRLS